MSIKIMSKIWEQSSHEGSPLLLLLALADHASDDGVCWPGIPRLAHKTRKTERHTKRLLVKLEGSGEVYIARQIGRGNTNMYYITLGFNEEEMVHTFIKRFEFDPAKADQIAKHIIQLQGKGDTQDTFLSEGEDEKGDIQGQEKVTPGDEKVTPGVQKDDIAVSPESFSTVIEPSEENRQKDTDSFSKNPEAEPFDAGTDLYWQHCQEAEANQKAAGNFAAPPPAGDDAAAAVALTAMYEAVDSEAPVQATGSWTKAHETVGQVLRDHRVTDPEIARIAGKGFGQANIETPHFVNPHLSSFPAAFGIYVGKAKKQASETDTRRARDVEATEMSVAALEERMAARPPPAEDDEVGQAVKGELRLQMTKATFETWVRPASMACDDGVFVVTAPDAFTRDWLENRLATTIRRTAVGVMGRTVEVRFEVTGGLPIEPLAVAPEEVEG